MRKHPEEPYRGGLVAALPNRDLFSPNIRDFVDFLEKNPRDRYTLLFFGYTYCPVVSMHMAQYGAALKRLPPVSPIRSQLVLLRPRSGHAEHPVQLRRWLENFDKQFVGLQEAGYSRSGPEG